MRYPRGIREFICEFKTSPYVEVRAEDSDYPKITISIGLRDTWVQLELLGASVVLAPATCLHD